MLVDNTLDNLGKQIEEKINACASTLGYPCTIPTNAGPSNDLLTNARLKKKEVQTKSSKRIFFGSIRSTRLGKREKAELHHSWVKRYVDKQYSAFGVIIISINSHSLQFSFTTRCRRSGKWQVVVVVHKLQMIEFIGIMQRCLKVTRPTLASLSC